MCKGSIMLFFVLLLSGCFESKKELQEAEFQWGVEFCGGQDKLKAFSLYTAIPSRVYCSDGRWSDVPR